MPVELHPTFGSRVRFLPELPIGSVAQSVEQKGSFTTDLSSYLTRNSRGECRMKLQHHNGMLREVRLLTLQALSGTSGTPGVSSSLVAAARQLEWRMQAGLQVARPSKDGRSGVQIILLPCGAGWRSHRLADPCRQAIEQANACGNTLVSGGSNPPVGRLIDWFSHRLVAPLKERE
jgi:hypothetical protein